MRTSDVVKALQDLTHLAWDEKATTSGTTGTFLKSRVETDHGLIYYKLSNYDRYRGIFGHESVNELVASRLLDRLGIPHVPYGLVHASVLIDGTRHETWLSESPDFREPGERKQAFDIFFDLNVEGDQAPLDFCADRGWGPFVYAMMAFDYLICNRDRHGANFEIVYSDGEVRPAPLFDHGLSFAFSTYDDPEKVAKFDPLEDRSVNNFLGTKSLEENLALLPPFSLRGPILEDGAEGIIEGLEDVVSTQLKEKLREMVLCRWRRLVDLGIAVEEGNNE